MPNSIPQPKPLDEWLSLLDNTRLPVHCGQKERVQIALTNSNNSLGDIAKVVATAPSIALVLFRESNKYKSTLSDPAQTLEAVLMRLGTARCKMLLARLEDDSEQDIPVALRQLWLIGQHANVQANALFMPKLARLWQEIHWGSLLFLSPLWPLVARYPDLFILWEQRILGEKEPIHKVEKELFGVPLTELCHALAQHWSLPEWIIAGYASLAQNRRIVACTLRIARQHKQPLHQQRMFNQQKEVYRWFSQASNSIVLANSLALAAHNSWGNEHCLRWQRFISLFIEQPLDQVQNRIHQNAASHAQQLGKTKLWHPAQALIWPWFTQRIQPMPRSSEHTPENDATSVKMKAAVWQHLAQQMLKHPSPFRNHTQLLDAFVRMLNACALSRCVLFNVKTASSQLKPVYQRGFKFSLQQPLQDAAQSQLLQRLLKQSALLHIHQDISAQLLRHLPPVFVKTINSNNFIFGSISLDNKVILLTIADDQASPLSNASVNAFAASCRHLEQALAIMYRKSR